jgi:hypothetical protein
VSPLRRLSPRQAWVIRRVSSHVPSVSRVVLSFINNSQDTDVRHRGVRRRDILVYCSCFTDRSAILDSNNWYLEPRLGRGEPAEDVNIGTTYGRGGACHWRHGRDPKASSCDSFVLMAADTRWRTVVGRSSSGLCVSLWRCGARRVSPAKKMRVSLRRRLQCLCGDGACRGGHVRSGRRSGGRGDEDDGSCRNSGNNKSRLGGGVVWRRYRCTDAPMWRGVW